MKKRNIGLIIFNFQLFLTYYMTKQGRRIGDESSVNTHTESLTTMMSPIPNSSATGQFRIGIKRGSNASPWLTTIEIKVHFGYSLP